MFKTTQNQVLAASKATYRGTADNWIEFYNDGSEDSKGKKGAFADISTAVDEAESFVFITGWSFHPDFFLQRGSNSQSIGRILLEKAESNPDLTIAIMPWCHKELPGVGVMTGDQESNDGDKTLQKIWRNWCRENNQTERSEHFPSNLMWRASPYGASNTFSHHQKFVVCDAPVDVREKEGARILKVFFGGLDITKGRFDWPEHPFEIEDPAMSSFRGRYEDWYNGEFGHDTHAVREPWHDVHAQLIGPAAWDFAHEFVARWCANQYYPRFSMSPLGDNTAAGHARVFEAYQQLLSGRSRAGMSIVQRDGPQPSLGKSGRRLRNRSWKAQVLRSMDKVGWGPPTAAAIRKCETKPTKPLLKKFCWSEKLKSGFERSIQDAYLEMVAGAKRFIYIESQFLISSGANWDNTSYGESRDSVENVVADAIIRRIKKAIRGKGKPEEFHVYIVLPMYNEGDPGSRLSYPIRYLQWVTMEYMVNELYKECGGAWRNYLSFQCLGNWEISQVIHNAGRGSRAERVAAARRYMIYVHSKAMIVDDEFGIIGSANLNERSLNGYRDSEIAVAFWPDDECASEGGKQLKGFRKKLWLEHMGPAWMKQHGRLDPGSRRCVEAVREAGISNYLNYLLGRRAESSGHLLQWPIETDGSKKFGFLTDFIPDHAVGEAKDPWTWQATWFLGTEYAVNQIPE